MEKLKFKLRQSSSVGIFHDSRADSRAIMKVLNLAIDKIDELVESNNNLQQQVEDLKKQLSTPYSDLIK